LASVTLSSKLDALNPCLGTLLSVLVVLGGCSGAAPPTPAADATVKLYVFDCGRLRLASIEIFSVSGDETDVRDMIVPCYMIEHDKGRLLWDGGLPSSTADVAGWQGERVQMRLDRTLSEQLAAMSLNMSSFDYVAYSHMHFDHVGVADEVDTAVLLMQQADYDAQFLQGLSPLKVDPALFKKLENSQKLLLNGDHDVFGDGRVRIISAPGHTPGHQVLLVDLKNTGPILIAGDLYHFALSRKERRVPKFNFDADMTLASMNRVEALVGETGATLWIEHELALFEQLKHAPSYYD
jgi:N-acyl homoserine lactone hydrolase